MSQTRNVLLQSVYLLLRPLARILLKQGISFAEFAEIAKKAYVDVAQAEFNIPGRKQSVSRVCVVTGIHRKDVNRLLAQQQEGEWRLEPLSRAARVIGGWLSDDQFLNKAGRPEVLPYEEGDASFSALVKKYSGDMPARAVLDELKLARAVEVTETGKLKLVSEAYLPVELDDQALQVMGEACSDLLETISFNLLQKDEESRFQLSVAYDNLSPEVVKEFKQMADKDSLTLLKRYNRWLAERDGDRPESVQAGNTHQKLRAGIGIYYFESGTLDPATTKKSPKRKKK